MHRITRLALAVALTVAVSACGDDPAPDAAPDSDTVTDAAPEPDADDDADADEAAEDAEDAGPGFGTAVETSVVLSGAVDESWATGGDVTFIAAGGCQGDQFGLQLQVNDATPRTVAQVLVEVDEDLDGGVTGSFAVEDLEVQLVSESFDITDYDGPGTLEITEHTAPSELNERRMQMTITGAGLEGPDGTVDVDASLDWVMGCP